MTVSAPFRTTTCPHFRAYSSAISARFLWISSTGSPVRADISPGWGVRTAVFPNLRCQSLILASSLSPSASMTSGGRPAREAVLSSRFSPEKPMGCLEEFGESVFSSRSVKKSCVWDSNPKPGPISRADTRSRLRRRTRALSALIMPSV